MRHPSATASAAQFQSTDWSSESQGRLRPFDRDRWLTDSLPLLEGLAPLLTGAADKRPTVGNGWEKHPGLSITQLLAANPECICWHIGATGTLYAAVDVDGALAAAFCQSHSCDPYTADTWRIIRTGNSERIKLVFRVTPEQRATLVAGAKTVKIDEQELAVFAKPGTQIVVLGNHYTKESGFTENDDQYAWAGRAPADAQPMPPEWFALLTKVFCGDRPLRPATRRACSNSTGKTNAFNSSSKHWINSSCSRPCQICGRDHSGACSIHVDGKSVWCFHGQTNMAPDCSKTGEKIPGSDGQTYGYVRTEEHDSFGERSLFVLHKPRPKPSQQAQQAHTTEQASEASTPKPRQHKERKARHMSHSKAMACFDRCVEVQAQRERNSLRRRARLLKAAKDLGLAAFINRQEIAQKVLEAKARCGGEGFKPLTAADRAAMPKPVVRWLVRGLIPANDLTIIGGRPKVGKTRLAVAIVAAVLRGEPFLEFAAPTSTPPVLLVTDDQSAGDTATMLTALGIWDHPRLITSDNFRLTEPDLDALLEAIKANPGAMVVIDSLRSIGRSLNHAENDVEIGATLYDLKQSVIDAGGTLLLIHHCNKAADLVGVEALSGHSAISGAANTVITLHHCPNDKGQPDKINPQRRLFSEGRSGEGCDLVIDRGAGAGTYRQVSTFEHWQQQLSEAKKNQKLERLTEMQQQALDALTDSGEWMTRRQVCEAIGVAWSERGRSREARKVGVSLHRLVELQQAESVRAGTEATFRASHETQNDIGTTGPISDASASQWPEAHRANRANRATDTTPELLAQVAQNGRATETDCSDKVARLSRTSQPTCDPQRKENEQRIRDHGRNTDLAGWSDSSVNISPELESDPFLTREVEMDIGKPGLVEIFWKGQQVAVLDPQTKQWGEGFTVLADTAEATVKVQTPTGKTANRWRNELRGV